MSVVLYLNFLSWSFRPHSYSQYYHSIIVQQLYLEHWKMLNQDPEKLVRCRLPFPVIFALIIKEYDT